MSRPFKPTALKVVQGVPGHRRLPENEPQPPKGVRMPKYLSKAAAQHWGTVVAQLEPLGVLTVVDDVALAMYCEQFALWRAATDAIARDGLVTISRHGVPKYSPHVGIAASAHDRMLRMLTEFGMTPASRPRLRTGVDPKAPGAASNPFASVKGSKGGA